MRQGDILSPILFNAALEHALGRWKDGLIFEGFALDGNSESGRRGADMSNVVVELVKSGSVLLFCKLRSIGVK